MYPRTSKSKLQATPTFEVEALRQHIKNGLKTTGQEKEAGRRDFRGRG